jgi:2-oxoglutarate ferredoxin oxidoreductase subunit beta
MLKQAHAHKGTAFIEIYQNCNVFNDLTFIQVTGKDVKKQRQILLEDGKPLVFDEGKKGIRMTSQGMPEIVELGEGGVSESELVVHDERNPNPAYAFMLAQMDYPDFPVPVGVLRAAEAPVYEVAVREQEKLAAARGPGDDIEKLWNMGDTWEAGA